jgi:hypothetical protein
MMRTSRLAKNIVSSFVSILGLGLIVVASGIMTGQTANAAVASSTGASGYQDRYRDRDRFDREDVMRIARENGYRDGLQAGEEDRDNGLRFEMDRHWSFRRADSGYRWEMGFRDLYRREYRDGFTRGYEDGFRGR